LHLTFLVFLILLSCNEQESSVITYDVQKSDYVDFVEIVGTIQAVRSTSVKVPPQAEKIVWLIPEGTMVQTGDTLARFSSTALESNVETLRNSLEEQKLTVPATEMSIQNSIATTKENLEMLDMDMAFKKLDSVRRPFMTPLEQKIFDMTYAQELSAMERRKKQLQSNLISLDSRLLSMRTNISRMEDRIRNEEQRLRRLAVVSPHSGVVQHVEREYSMSRSMSTVSRQGGTDYITRETSAYDAQVLKEGTEVYSGETVLNIPDLSQVRIRLLMPEVDYRKVEADQKVFISVDASSGLETTGFVEKKTLTTGSPRGQRAGSQVKQYEVLVSVDSCHLLMKPGTSARCRIQVHDVRDTIVVPSVALFTRDSVKVAYVAEGKKFRPVPVETGPSNSSRSIVVKGLKIGQTIALMEPPERDVIPVVLPRPVRKPASETDSVQLDSSKTDTVAQFISSN